MFCRQGMVASSSATRKYCLGFAWKQVRGNLDLLSGHGVESGAVNACKSGLRQWGGEAWSERVDGAFSRAAWT